MFAKFVKPRFNISATEVKRLAEEFVRIEQENDDQISNGKKMDKDIIAIPRNQRTFQNTIRPLLAYDHNGQGASTLF